MKIKNIVFTVIAVILAILLFNPNLLPLSAETRTSMKELITQNFLLERSMKVTMAHVLTFILAICVVWIVYSVLKFLLNLRASKSAHDATVATLLIGLIRYLAVIVAFIWGLHILGVNTTAVLAGAGIIGLIIGFGAQSLIEDIITGLFIIFEGQYKIGDIIILDEFRGTVRSIGVRTTTIEDVGGNLKIVNNSDIRNLQNRSANKSVALCVVAVAYDTDLRRLERIVKDALPDMYKGNEDLYLSAPRYLGVEELADSGITLKFAADCKEENIFNAQRRLRRDIKNLFDDTGITIPFPQVVVHKGK
ncbi:MAG: mechanosensitive ion channel family protein [Erysipelotrichaceae bacterium]|nr:mechanosensitive ion channel family protein [Erysipelotrichaceae bacterium]